MISIMSSAASFRTEKDLLGVLEVPAQAYYGIQTLRAVNNFRLSGVPISHYPKLVVGLAMVKQAAADANRELGHLSDAKHAAISEACARPPESSPPVRHQPETLPFQMGLPALDAFPKKVWAQIGGAGGECWFDRDIRRHDGSCLAAGLQVAL